MYLTHNIGSASALPIITKAWNCGGGLTLHYWVSSSDSTSSDGNSSLLSNSQNFVTPQQTHRWADTGVTHHQCPVTLCNVSEPHLRLDRLCSYLSDDTEHKLQVLKSVRSASQVNRKTLEERGRRKKGWKGWKGTSEGNMNKRFLLEWNHILDHRG